MFRRAAIAIILIGAFLSSLTVQNALQSARSADANQSSKSNLSVSAYENVSIHEGNLVINGTQTFVIENCTYTQTGNIYVKDQARLLISNSYLRINQRYNYEYHIAVQDNATLELESATVASTFEGPDLYFDGTSRGTINASTLARTPISSWTESNVVIIGSTFQEAEPGGNSQLLILNSTFLWATNLYFGNNDIVYLVGLRPGYCDYWNLHANQTFTNVSYNFTIVDTSVVAWSLTLDYDTIAEILNSTIERISYSFFGRSIQADGLRPGFYVNWTLHNATLINVEVTGHWVFLSSGESSGTITNTHAYLSLFAGKAHFSIADSYVLLTSDELNSGDLAFSRSTFTISHLGIHNSDFYIHGDVHVEPPTWSYSWISSNITRNYDIVTKDMSGSPTENVELRLFDKNNAIIWSGLSDSLGHANLNLTFTDDNHTDTLRLEAFKGNSYDMTAFSFLSDTPVVLTLALHDISVQGVTLSRTVVGQGYSLGINATITNLGDSSEAFHTMVYANATHTGTDRFFYLANGTSMNAIISCNTASLAYGNYTLSVCVEPVLDEISTADNNRTFSIPVHVGVPGDISGPTQGVYDGKCDMRDISYLIIRFNTKPDSTKWNPNADINNDATVNMRDISIAILNFNKHE